MNPHDLYERSVTNPAALVAFILAAYAEGASTSARGPKVLREDFSGSAALAKHFAASSRARRAIAVDRDPIPLAHAAGPRMTLVLADVLEAKDRADIIAATNFALGYSHTRAALITYLRHAHACLARRGLFLADIYGGHTAFRTGSWTRTIRHPQLGTFLYRWNQREADPTTGMVRNSIDFGITTRAKKKTTSRSATKSAPATKWTKDAFTYHWHLWSMPELRDAMSEAGFQHIDFYDSLGDALDHRGNAYICPLRPEPVSKGSCIPMDRDWVVYAVARS
jgi:hypothetical protein